jgi:polyphosphate kinase
MEKRSAAKVSPPEVGGEGGWSGAGPRLVPDSPERFVNRELSWLAFDERVVEEAVNETHPLLERLRFLAISFRNLDEFYMVRVAGLKGELHAGVETPSADGLTPEQQLAAINRAGGALMVRQQRIWRQLREELRAAGIVLLEPQELGGADRDWLDQHFYQRIFPALTPTVVSAEEDFPFVPNGAFVLALELRETGKGQAVTGLVRLPSRLARFIRLPGGRHRFVRLEQVVRHYLDRLFPGAEVGGHGAFRILRDSGIEIEEQAEDLLRVFESALEQRARGAVIRLTVEAGMPAALGALVRDRLGVAAGDVFTLDGLLGLADVEQLVVGHRPDLLFQPYHARFPERIRDFDGDCFAAIHAKDIVVHHPYESFDVVARFIAQAAADEKVVAIEQTLYRTSEHSPVIEALVAAAEAGKAVTVLVELKARFDEKRNIRSARAMERAGVRVIYGFADLKIHAKVTRVVRREGGALRVYVHYGTGNYHPAHARTYTDLSFFTCDPALGRDAGRLFDYLSGRADPPEAMEKLIYAPRTLRATILDLIEDEVAQARAGRPAAIWAKLNTLVDPDIIDALYRASRAGVAIDLVVRGICCLRPQVPGFSDNIRVKSIVGRYLEHGRILCFGAGRSLPSPEAKVFISSADWMPRNMDRRVETLVPVENPTVHRQILDQIMIANLNDEAQSWVLGSDGRYRRVEARAGAFSAHGYFMANPSLSGRGSALARVKEVPRLVLKRSESP